MTGRSNCYIRKIFFSLLIFSGLTASLYSQSDKIGGIINVYKHVTAIGPGPDNVTLTDVGSLIVGDTVLLVQMKGSIIYVPETLTYGLYRESYGASGACEFLIIQSIAGNTVTFRNNILSSFNVAGMVQLIKVPYYNSATVITELTCQPWDSISKTGGVLAMIVGKTLSLNADINVSGKGFVGGKTTLGSGICVQTDIAIYDKYSYPESSLYSGYKGESQVIRAYIDASNIPPIFPVYAKGKGANFTGGGGGNGRFSGGGGGANYGVGGKGGNESSFCSPFEGAGATGGKSVKVTDLNGKIFFGGGGGSSTYLSGATVSPGGNGGGIVIVICDTLKGKGKSIKANGNSPVLIASGNTDNAGAGGGGAGGSIALFQQSYGVKPDSSVLTISANGGKGGSTSGTFGEGGGGGGGLILTNNITETSVSKLVNPGAAGSKVGGPTAAAGTAGEKLTTFTPLLNGFLFNSVRSAVTGTLTDSICSNVLPPKISGTKPVGGTIPYTYLWEKSYDEISWTPLTNDADPTNYTPTVIETNTVYYRRTVTDSDPTTPLVDVSKPVKIIVQPAITGNLVGNDTTICYGQDPLGLIPLNAGPSNGSSSNYYLYKWIQNNTNTGWGTSPAASGTYINAGYDPPALTNTTYYQRVVTSGRCIDYSSTVTITVLPSITGNTITQPDEVICEGSLFTLLDATAPGGGDLSYKYQWQDSISASLNFLPAVGTNTASTYTPDTSTFAVEEQRYLRRIVFSGPDSVCQDRSNPILLTRYHKIGNNTITADQTICSGSIPVSLAGSIPTAGDLSYTYQWQDSTKSGAWTPKLGAPDFSFSPPALSDTTWYRRMVFSSVCTNASLPVIVNVHKPILDNNITLLAGGLTDTTICSGATPNLLKGPLATGGTDLPGDYVYQWIYSTDNSTWNPVPSAGTGLDYQPLSLANTTYYRRQVVSGTCAVESNSITVNVLPLISNNVISSNQTICYNTPPAALTGLALAGGDGTYTFVWEESADGTTWTSANTNSGVNNAANYQPPALTVPMKYKRIVTSGSNGCCISVSNIIDVGIYALPTGQITNTADTTICGGSIVDIKVLLTGAAPWKATISENGSDLPEATLNTANSFISQSPASPSAVNNFNYLFSKLVDNNGCEATSFSGSKNAIVYQVPVADAGPDTSVCGPSVTLSAIPSVGTGTWTYPSAVVASSLNNPSVTVTIDSTFSGINISHWFLWEELNGQCADKDSVKIRFDKRIDFIVNAGRDTTITSPDNEIVLVADPVLYGSGKWSVEEGSGKFEDASSESTRVTDLDVSNKFKWTVTNGQCPLSDMINVFWGEDFLKPQGFSPNGDGVNDIYIIRGLSLSEYNAEFRVLNGAGIEVFYTSSTNINIENIEWNGKNANGTDLPEGTYYYILKTQRKPDNAWRYSKGFIILKRY